jgi:CSLREA domain-containing protein
VVNSILDTTTAGDTNCTLREAIINANNDSDLTSGDCPAGSGHDSITFSLASNSEILLAGQQLPEITSRVTIDGQAVANLTINGNSQNRLFEIGYADTVTITHLILTNGLAEDNQGGAIRNDGYLTVSNSTF